MKKRKTKELVAAVKNLDDLLDWLDGLLTSCGFTGNSKVQLDIAVEEIYVNIAHYAFEKEGAGNVTVTLEVDDDPLRAVVRLEDRGKPYDPMKRENPDITLPIRQRKIGGLGIYMTKTTMDDMFYEYKDGKNILTIAKNYVGDGVVDGS